MKKAGRPKDLTKLSLMTLTEAVAYMRERVRAKYKNEEAVEKFAYQPKTFYNKIYESKITNYGNGQGVMLAKSEVDRLIKERCK